MNALRKSRRPAILAIVLLLVLGAGVVTALGAMRPSQAIKTPGDHAPTAQDAARTAAEQLRLLPATASQVDCAPGVRTLPIYTTLSGTGGPHRLIVLADGRCFQDSASSGDVPVEQIEP